MSATESVLPVWVREELRRLAELQELPQVGATIRVSRRKPMRFVPDDPRPLSEIIEAAREEVTVTVTPELQATYVPTKRRRR